MLQLVQTAKVIRQKVDLGERSLCVYTWLLKLSNMLQLEERFNLSSVRPCILSEWLHIIDLTMAEEHVKSLGLTCV